MHNSLSVKFVWNGAGDGQKEVDFKGVSDRFEPYREVHESPL